MIHLNITGYTADDVYNLVIADLERRRAALVETISTLRGELGAPPAFAAKRGRPAKTAANTAPKSATRRKLSPEALQAIRDGQKKRWAKARRAARKPKGQKLDLSTQPQELAGAAAAE